MICYGYVCEHCEHEFEIEQSIHEDALTWCPGCSNNTLIRKIYSPFLHIVGEPTTIGHLAAKNTERMGHYEYEDKMAQRKKRIQVASDKFCEQTGGKNVERGKELPWYRSGKVEGLPRIEQPLKPAEAEKVAKELKINIKEPKQKRKSNGSK